MATPVNKQAALFANLGALAGAVAPSQGKPLCRWIIANILAGTLFSLSSSMLAQTALVGVMVGFGLPFLPLLVFGLWALLGLCQWFGLRGWLRGDQGKSGLGWAALVGLAGLGATLLALAALGIVGLDSQSAFDPLINSRGQGLHRLLILAVIGGGCGLLVGGAQRLTIDAYSARPGWVSTSILSWSGGLALAGWLFGEGGLRLLSLLSGYGSPFYGLADQVDLGQRISSAVAGGFTLGVISLPLGLRIPYLLDRRVAKPEKPVKLLLWAALAAIAAVTLIASATQLPANARQLQFAFGDVRTVAWSPDSSYVAVSGSNQQAQVWDVNSGATIAVLSGGAVDRYNSGYRVTMSWSPDGRWLALSASELSNVLQLWDTQSWAQAKTIKIDQAESISTLAWAPDSRRLAVALTLNTSLAPQSAVEVWDPLAQASQYGIASTLDPALRRRLSTTDPVSDLAWSPDGAMLAVSGINSQVCSVGVGASCAGFGPGAALLGASWSPDGTRILYHSAGAAGVWELAQRRISASAELFRGYSVGLAWSTSGLPLVAAVPWTEVDITSLPLTSATQSYPFPDFSLTVLSWSPDGQRLLGGSDYGRVLIWSPTQ